MRKYLKLFLALSLVSIFSISCIQAKEPQEQALRAALGFNLKDLSQKTVSLSDYKDKQPVILVFWTTWCHFCRQQLKSLNNRYPGLLADGLAVLAINVGEAAPGVKNFVRNQGLAFSALLDEDNAVADSYGIQGVPTYILIDKQGRIRFRGHSFPQDYKKLISQ